MFNFSVKANNSVGTSAPVHIVAMTTDGMCVQYECICAHLYYDIINFVYVVCIFLKLSCPNLGELDMSIVSNMYAVVCDL